MASEQDSAVRFITVFEAITFAPLVMVGLLILLAAWLAILEAFSWFWYKLHEYRARQALGHALAQNMDNGSVESGPRRGEGIGNSTEEFLMPVNAVTEERVWWAIYL
ncbi:MAG: hypothetical protein ALECFALPRED_005225 [Alectoria fallacina]|uniref:Uncharacterized protein n=1 Tax=Alectoria fallacina TaxID=1903189 RepID=A0A8H3IX94_9LECA|nr:MAG: hypothetical protein ALECFALPRED_005225 [Alectoria fallacina]